jgi:hypothetical protein
MTPGENIKLQSSSLIQANLTHLTLGIDNTSSIAANMIPVLLWYCHDMVLTVFCLFCIITILILAIFRKPGNLETLDKAENDCQRQMFLPIQPDHQWRRKKFYNIGH